MICAQIGKELPDRRQKEGRIEFIRVGDVLNLPAIQETLVRILGWEDLLEKG